MRMYAIVGTIQVISDSTSKLSSLFGKKNKTTLSPQDAKNLFYSTNSCIELYKSYDDALFASINLATYKGKLHGKEESPNRHKYYATPIFTIELADNYSFTHRGISKINLNEELSKKFAHEIGMRDITERDITNCYCEKKDAINLIAVDVPHPNFKKQHIEIDRPVVKVSDIHSSIKKLN